MFLSNTQIKLRAVEPEDLDILYKWENNSDIWTCGNTLSPYSKLALRQYINDAQHMDIYQSKQLRLMIELNEKHITIGTIDLYDIDMHNKRAGIGILIDAEHRCQSFASQALQLMHDYAFGFIGLHQLYAYISVNNQASIHLFRKAGYTSAAIIRDWIRKGNDFENIESMQLINS